MTDGKEEGGTSISDAMVVERTAEREWEAEYGRSRERKAGASGQETGV
jgi:hypothetical protein